VELRAKAEFTEIVEGKKKSTLEEQKVLYVLYEGEMHQLTIRGSSSWNFSKYKKTTQIPLVVTTLDSEEAENGSNRYNKMTFSVARNLTNDEAMEVLEFQNEIKSGIAEKNAYFAKFKVDDESPTDITAEFKVTPKGMDPKMLADGHEM
jgi:predicted Zn-dependent protease